jgi:hypothetical protein
VSGVWHCVRGALIVTVRFQERTFIVSGESPLGCRLTMRDVHSSGSWWVRWWRKRRNRKRVRVQYRSGEFERRKTASGTRGIKCPDREGRCGICSENENVMVINNAFHAFFMVFCTLIMVATSRRSPNKWLKVDNRCTSSTNCVTTKKQQQGCLVTAFGGGNGRGLAVFVQPSRGELWSSMMMCFLRQVD